MGRLLSFLGGAAKSLQNTIDQDRTEKQRAEDDDKRFKMNLSYAKAANAINIMQEQASKPADQRASGAPFLTAPGGYQQNTEVATPVEFDENYDVKRAAGWAPGPSISVAAPPPMRVKAGETLYDPITGDELMTGKEVPMTQYQRERNEILRSKGGGGGGGMTAWQESQTERQSAQDQRQAKIDANAEVGARMTPFSDQIAELETAVDESGGSELSRFMASQGAPRQAQTNVAAAKTWMREKLKSDVYQEYGVGATNERKPSNPQSTLSAPPAAVAELKADPSPEAKRDFDEVFGEGAADRALGRR